MTEDPDLSLVSDKRNSTYLDQFVDDVEFCNGKIKSFKEFYYGTIEQCPECEHWNSTVHNSGDDVVEEWVLLCHCCSYMGDYET